MTTPEQLQHAREWAEEFYPGFTHVGFVSAAEIIASLPDTWVSSDELKEESKRMEAGAKASRKPGHNEYSRGYADAMEECAQHLLTLLPAPQFEVKWGKFAWHERYEKVLIVSSPVGESVQVSTKAAGVSDHHHFEWVPVSELKDLPEELPEEAQAVMAESIEEFKRGEFVDIDFGESDTAPTVGLPTVGEAWIVEYQGKNYYALHDGGVDDNHPWSLVVKPDSGAISRCESEITRVAQLVPKDTK